MRAVEYENRPRGCYTECYSELGGYFCGYFNTYSERRRLPGYGYGYGYGGAATCDGTDTCYGHSCDDWVAVGYDCDALESQYSCDCSGCACVEADDDAYGYGYGDDAVSWKCVRRANGIRSAVATEMLTYGSRSPMMAHGVRPFLRITSLLYRP